MKYENNQKTMTKDQTNRPLQIFNYIYMNI